MSLATDEIEIPPFVVCQNCMATMPFSLKRHQGEENCNCGGDFCGCADCMVASIDHEISKTLKPN